MLTSCTALPECGTTDIFRFQDLVFDVQAYIIKTFVTPQDLLALSLVSKDIGSIATQTLYSDVRLLFHLASSRSNGHEGVSLTELKDSQKAFATQITHHKDRACRVRSMTWQVSGSGGDIFASVFPLLKNLTQIHLIDAHPTHLAERASYLRSYHKPEKLAILTLFPRVHSVRFTGTTSLALVIPILHSPHRLTSLSLDTISPHSVALDLLKWVSMAGLLNLRVLSLRALHPSQDSSQCNDTQQKELIFSWREILSAVRNTVETVTLGFRERIVRSHAPTVHYSTETFEQFSQIVIPVFWEEGWSHLRTLRLEGTDVDSPGMLPSLRLARLHAAIPIVVVDRKSLPVHRVWYSEAVEEF